VQRIKLKLHCLRGLFENAKARSSLLNEFGPNMGENLIADPDNNSFAATPQLGRSTS